MCHKENYRRKWRTRSILHSGILPHLRLRLLLGSVETDWDSLQTSGQ